MIGLAFGGQQLFAADGASAILKQKEGEALTLAGETAHDTACCFANRVAEIILRDHRHFSAHLLKLSSRQYFPHLNPQRRLGAVAFQTMPISNLRIIQIDDAGQSVGNKL